MTYTFSCPHCNSTYVGDSEDDPQHRNYTCEDCNKNFEVSIFLELNVRVSKLPSNLDIENKEQKK